ncbi:MAG: hypothetical protein F4Y01_16500 [Gammaproteobacteria bacterium]|nr:hypothetical protein [Gammaproteobacteria bacterium]
MDSPSYLDVTRLRALLTATGRGKHLRATSYFHLDLVRRRPGIAESLSTTWDRFAAASPDYNVVKLQPPSRVSFLTYDDFANAFPVLAHSLAIDIAAGVARQVDYRGRDNPPILHRKELLLPACHPLVAPAADLTARLEARGAFSDPRRIGTVDGWSRALADVGLGLERGQVVGW